MVRDDNKERVARRRNVLRREKLMRGIHQDREERFDDVERAGLRETKNKQRKS